MNSFLYAYCMHPSLSHTHTHAHSSSALSSRHFSLQTLIRLPSKISDDPFVIEFFEARQDDITPQTQT